MHCKNNLCIYCENEKCILDTISLDAVGMCLDSIQITIDDTILKAEKLKLLLKLHKDEFLIVP